MKRLLLPVLLFASLASCAFHSTANRWHETVGPNGEPVYLKSTTSVGLNLFIIFGLFGKTDTVGMIDELTGEIASEGGDRVRIVQSTTENYWYGFPPLTWILTPVITNVAAEYEPDPEVRAADLAEQAQED